VKCEETRRSKLIYC